MKVYIVKFFVRYDNNNSGNLRVFKDEIVAKMFIERLNKIKKELNIQYDNRSAPNNLTPDDKKLCKELWLSADQSYGLEEIEFVDGIEETKAELSNLINKLEL